MIIKNKTNIQIFIILKQAVDKLKVTAQIITAVGNKDNLIFLHRKMQCSLIDQPHALKLNRKDSYTYISECR